MCFWPLTQLTCIKGALVALHCCGFSLPIFLPTPWHNALAISLGLDPFNCAEEYQSKPLLITKGSGYAT